MIVLVSRRPDAVFDAQFWAEDGRNWYPDAYNNGVMATLLTPEAGYLQTFSRLIAGASQLVPLWIAPLFFNLSAIAVQLVVVGLILSRRFSKLIPRFHHRLLFAFLYAALPHSSEVIANLTNAQWHLALLSSLVILLPAESSRSWKLFDVVVVSVSVLSGPFALLLLPICALKYYFRREPRLIVLNLILVVGSAVQLAFLLTTIRPIQAELGASLSLLLKIIGRHVFASFTVGGNGFLRIPEHLQSPVAIVCALAGAVLIGYVFYRAKLELRLFIIFSILIVAAALYSPAVTLMPGQWNIIAANETAQRYWFIPGLCFYMSLFVLAGDKHLPLLRYGGFGVLLLSAVGIAADWRIAPLKDLQFQRYAAEFENAPPGTQVSIPINPDWQMRLTKK